MQKKKTIWTIHGIHGIDNLLQIYHVYWPVRDLSLAVPGTCSGQQRIASNSFIFALKNLEWKNNINNSWRKLSLHFFKKLAENYLCENQFDMGRNWSNLLMIIKITFLNEH